jgi:hypothetical protein
VQRFRNLTASGLFCQPDFFLKDCQDGSKGFRTGRLNEY